MAVLVGEPPQKPGEKASAPPDVLTVSSKVPSRLVSKTSVSRASFGWTV
ncbi:hypothetical protein [Sphingopyxis sp. PET50]|nr:hypothetical protein [Sphingopyxis sp. PET50]